MNFSIIEKLSDKEAESLKKLQPEGWGDIVPVFMYYASKQFCTPIKVFMGEDIIGVGTAIVFGKTAWLAHIIVRQDHRNRGLGKEIVRKLLEITNTSKCDTVSLIATELGCPVYEKAGFRVQTEYVFFDLENEEDIKAEYIEPLTPENVLLVMKMDEKISGEKRSCILSDKINDGFVYKKNAKIQGFFLPKMGEGLIIAENAEAGIELMKKKQTMKNKAVLPSDNLEGIKFLKSIGCAEKKRAKRMILGKEFPWQPDKLYGRIGGNFG